MRIEEELLGYKKANECAEHHQLSFNSEFEKLTTKK